MKRINLDQMKNMSIDNLIELYRDGYRLGEHTPITSLSNFHTPNFSNNFSNIHALQGPLLDPVVNFGKVTVSTGYDAAANSIILNTNEGSKLPDPSVSGAFNLVWWNSTDYPDPSDDPNKEIVRCTTRITDTLTVVRSQEGTSASIKNLAGKTYKMILSPTAKMISDISSHIGTSVAHGVTSNIVGISDTQTLANKTLTSPFISTIYGGSAANDDITIEGTSNATKTSSYVILQPSGGNVGIGTTSPTYKLDVTGSLRSSDWFSCGAAQVQLNTSLSSEALILASSDATKGGIVFQGLAGNTVPSGSTRTISMYGGECRLILGDSNDDVSLSNDRLFVKSSNGNVGIGTTSPGAKLDVQEGILRVYSGGATSQIDFKRTSDNWHLGSIRTTYQGSYGNNLLFDLHPNDGVMGTTPITRLVIQHDGNIGVNSGACIYFRPTYPNYESIGYFGVHDGLSFTSHGSGGGFFWYRYPASEGNKIMTCSAQGDLWIAGNLSVGGYGGPTPASRTLPSPTINEFSNESYIDDGNTGTAMTSGQITNTTRTVLYDLSSVKLIQFSTYCSLYGDASASHPKIELFSSLDNTNFLSLAMKESTGNTGEVFYRLLTFPTFARYIKIVSTHTSSLSHASTVRVYEIGLYY